jgi:hypothetical protein
MADELEKRKLPDVKRFLHNAIRLHQVSICLIHSLLLTLPGVHLM